jgi:Ni/Fe-hydrogenase b-type cytochrome subunit
MTMSASPATIQPLDQPSNSGGSAGPSLVYRHKLLTRLWHWLNALAIFVLLMSGLGIFNAHPMLYWGQYGANLDTPWLTLDRFPSWATIPGDYSLALSRHWHLAFAWLFGLGLLTYLVASLINRHLQKDIALSRAEVAPSHLWEDIKKHARFDFHESEARYNPLQKITYSLILFVILPLVIATGLCMSPGFGGVVPWLTDVFGGRQSARSIHFLCAGAIAAFIVVHLLLVILAGPINEMRSMITGWFKLSPGKSS